MNYTAFQSLVSDSLARGSSVTALIPGWIQRAGQYLEQTQDWPYMRQYYSFTIDADATYPRSIALPSRVKHVDVVRILESTSAGGSYTVLLPVFPIELLSLPTQRPSGFWISERAYLWFDAIPDQDYDGEIVYSAYTDWESLSGSDEPWFMANAQQLLLAQTVLFAGPDLRDNDIMLRYKPLRDEALAALLAVEEEFSRKGKRAVMGYGRIASSARSPRNP